MASKTAWVVEEEEESESDGGADDHYDNSVITGEPPKSRVINDIELIPFTFDLRHKKYFESRVIRDPYSGRVMFADVDSEYNFVLVDLGSSGSVSTNPNELLRKKDTQWFYFKPLVLETRTWLLAELTMFESSTDAADAREKIARRAAAKAEKAGFEGEVNDKPRNEEQMVKLALSDFQIERNSGIDGGSFGCSSPMYSYAAICFLANCSGDLTLAVLSIICFFVINAATLTCNTVYRLGASRGFQVARWISLPLRLLFVVQTVLGVSAAMTMGVALSGGFGIEGFTILSAAVLGLVDLRHDFAMAFSRTVSTKFTVLEALPGGVYICKKFSKMMGPAGHMLPERIVGPMHRKEKGAVVIVNVGGLLVELKELKEKDMDDLRGRHKVYQTKTFSEDCDNYTAVKEAVQKEEEIFQATERLKQRKKDLIRMKREKERAEMKAVISGM